MKTIWILPKWPPTLLAPIKPSNYQLCFNKALLSILPLSLTEMIKSAGKIGKTLRNLFYFSLPLP